MSDYKGLVFTLRSMRNETCNTAAEKIERQAVSLKALAGEVERLKDLLGFKVNLTEEMVQLNKERVVAENERDRLKAALDQVKHLSRLRISEREDAIHQTARKALGGDTP